MSATPDFEVALLKCFFCGDDSEIVLNTRLTPRDAANVRAMHQKVAHMEPCNKCKDLMKQGVILLTIDVKKSDPNWNRPPSGDERKNWMPNPYRTGGFFVLTDNGIRRAIQDEAIGRLGPQVSLDVH